MSTPIPPSNAPATPPPKSPAPAHRRTVQRWLVSAVTERLPVKLAALFLSLVLWLVVSAEEPTEDWVDVRVALVMDSTSVVLADSVPTVQALVIGRGRELLKLYTEIPVIRRGVGTEGSDNVVLDLRPGDVDVPSKVDVRVRDVRPRTISFHLRRVTHPRD